MLSHQPQEQTLLGPLLQVWESCVHPTVGLSFVAMKQKLALVKLCHLHSVCLISPHNSPVR